MRNPASPPFKKGLFGPFLYLYNMNKKTLFTLAGHLSKFWKEGDNPISFTKELLSNKKYKIFFGRLNVSDLLIVSIIINAKKKGLNPEEEYEKYELNAFSFSTVLVTEHEPDIPCENCGESGEVTCGNCNGRGTEECPDCFGSGTQDCSNCDGNGQEECTVCDGTGYEDEDEECNECDGDGTTDCDMCDGSGREDCRTCDGGEIHCETCGASGNESCDECSGTGYIDGYDKLAINQDYYVSYDLEIKDLLERKPHLSEISEKLYDKIMESPRTFLVNDYNGIMDKFEDSADNTMFFGELEEGNPSIMARGNGKVLDIFSLTDLFD